MEFLIYFLLFLIGICFGSFGSVLIWRLKGVINKDIVKGILYGRSQCPRCKSKLGFFDLFPIFSRLFYGGKCKHCSNKISSFYILLELTSGLSFVFSYRFVSSYFGVVSFGYDFILSLVFIIGLNWLLILTVFSDLLFYEMNDVYRITIGLWIIIWQFSGLVGNFQLAFLGGLVFFIGFMFIYLFGKLYVRFRYKVNFDGFGLGDVIIGFLVGMMFPFILKFNAISKSDVYLLFIIYMFLSSFFGIVFSVMRVILFRKSHGQSIPFLPAMILAYWVLLIFSGNIIDYLTDLF